MAKVNALTPEQTARFPEFVDKWTKIGLCTDAADRPRAERAINLMYERANLPKPKRIVWCGSPLSMAITYAVLRKLGAKGENDPGLRKLREQLALAQEVRAALGAHAFDAVAARTESNAGEPVRRGVAASIWQMVVESIGSQSRDDQKKIGESVKAGLAPSGSMGDFADDNLAPGILAQVAGVTTRGMANEVARDVRRPIEVSIETSLADALAVPPASPVRSAARDASADAAAVAVARRTTSRARQPAEAIGDGVRVATGAGGQVRDMRRETWTGVQEALRDGIRASVSDTVFGQHDAPWLAFFDFFRTAVGLVQETARLDGLFELAQSAGWAIPCANMCLVCERHSQVHRDDRGRLHATRGPAVAYPDGWAVYAVHGVRIPAWIIEQPERLTVAAIDKETNAEVRRVMIDCYPEKNGLRGFASFIKDSGAKAIDHDERFGTLYRRPVRDDEDLCCVEVRNRSPEPSGEFRVYLLRVPPTTRTALEGVAWTFGMSAEEYKNGLVAET